MWIKKNIKSFIYYFLNVMFFFNSYPDKAAILMYHSIDTNNLFFTVSPDYFSKQIAYLRKNKFNIITLNKLIGLLKKKQSLPKKTVVITFDDGHRDNYYKAWPILKKYGVPATIFIAPNLIDQNEDVDYKPALRMLNWNQIQDMQQSGLIDFQPHGLTHKQLNKLSLKKAKYEIQESKRIIEERLSKKCYIFAFPKGGLNKEIIDILKKNGFNAALTLDNGLVDKMANLFKLSRQSINSETNMTQFKGKLKFNLKMFK